MAADIFDISFEHNGKLYKGWANPSDKVNGSGAPVSFHVVLNDISFGYLSFNDCKWSINEQRPEEIVQATGKAIEKHYKL